MCSICKDPIYGVVMQQQILKQKYTQVFTFFFSKSINEILHNKGLHHVQIFKEFLFYDDEEEYLQGWSTKHAKDHATSKHLQPLLRDLYLYHKVKSVFQCSRAPAKAQPQRHGRKRQAEFAIQGSFLEDVQRHEDMDQRSFETIVHDIFVPHYSSDDQLQKSPEKKPPRIAKKPYSQLDIPKYVFDTKMRKINVSIKRSFDTFGSTHNSVNSTKKLETVQQSRSSQSSLQIDRNANRSSFKSFLNMQILEKASKGSKSLCNGHLQDVNQFYQHLQHEDHIKIDDQSHKQPKRVQQYTALQLFQKLQQVYNEQNKRKSMHPEQQKSLQTLLKKYQKYISVSPINKPEKSGTVTQSLTLSTSLKMKSECKPTEDQCYLYGLQTKSQSTKAIERRISFSKRQ